MSKILSTTLLFGLFFICLISVAASQEIKQYETSFSEEQIVIDGAINENAWNSVIWESGFIQTEPDNGAVPTQQTQFKIIHDNAHLHVAIRAFDNSPDSIVVADSPRDFFEGDYVEINIDSNLDGQQAYSFTATAGGVRGDEHIKSSDHWENDWNPAWELATKIDKLGWVAEFKIPFSELDYYEQKRQWGIQVNRSLERLDEGSSWSPIPDEDQWVASFGRLNGIENIPVSEAPKVSNIIGQQQFAADLNQFYQSLQRSYPSLYRYRSKVEIDGYFTEAMKQITGDLTLLECYKIISWFVSKIGDGHMQVKLPDQVMISDFPKRKVLPFTLNITEKGTWIKEAYAKDQSMVQAQLIAINGRPMKDIVTELIEYIPSDGLNQTGKYFHLSENFDFYSAFISPPADAINIEYLQVGDQSTQKANVSLISKDERDEMQHSSNKKPFELNYHQAVAVLRISTFNDPYNFQKFVDESFRDMRQKGASKLILDFRGNGGGEESNAIHLYRYLAKEPFQYYDRYEVNTALAAGTQPESSLISFETLNFLGKMSTVNASSQAILSKLEMLEGRFIDLNTSQSLHAENHFSGEVLVLIDGGSFSATSELCAIMKRDGRAIFIGEETGGTLDGNTSGISDQITLPGSRIKIRVPLIKYVSAIGDIDYEDGRGIFPDHYITPSDEKEDIALQFALDLLGSQ